LYILLAIFAQLRFAVLFDAHAAVNVTVYCTYTMVWHTQQLQMAMIMKFQNTREVTCVMQCTRQEKVQTTEGKCKKKAAGKNRQADRVSSMKMSNGNGPKLLTFLTAIVGRSERMLARAPLLPPRHASIFVLKTNEKSGLHKRGHFDQANGARW
jgi:hypothetical protein